MKPDHHPPPEPATTAPEGGASSNTDYGMRLVDIGGAWVNPARVISVWSHAGGTHVTVDAGRETQTLEASKTRDAVAAALTGVVTSMDSGLPRPKVTDTPLCPVCECGVVDDWAVTQQGVPAHGECLTQPELLAAIESARAERDQHTETISHLARRTEPAGFVTGYRHAGQLHVDHNGSVYNTAAGAAGEIANYVASELAWAALEVREPTGRNTTPANSTPLN